MKISVIGSGYVGLITGVGFASKGHFITCVDVDKAKVERINKGEPPIYEKDLEQMLGDAMSKRRFCATTDLKTAILNTELSFVCVGTPSRDDGSIDLTYVEGVCNSIGEVLKEKQEYHTIVIKSTVVPGTTGTVCVPLLEESSGKKAGRDFGVCMSPEFLREGLAMDDFLSPSRHVIGAFDTKSSQALYQLYSEFNCPIVTTDLSTAEMIKYASNLFLASKISYINEIGNLCKLLGADVYKVAEGMGLDSRISPYFLSAGLGYGGSCLPKDTKALVAKAKEIGYDPKLLEAINETNNMQCMRFLDLARKKLGSFQGKKVAVLGLAFKPGTDDMRESPAIPIVKKLIEEEAQVSAYDPKAIENAKPILGDSLEYCGSAPEALKDADLCLLVTDWKEFKNLDFGEMKQKIVVEGRKVLRDTSDIDFEGICWD